MSLDREKLHNALNDTGKECLYFCVDNAEKQISPSSFVVQSIGKVDIPLSVKNISRIRKAYKQPSKLGNNQNAQCQVPAASLQGLSSDKTHPLTIAIGKLTASSLRNTFGIDLSHASLNVKAKLEKLVICRDSECFSDSFNFEKDPGMFGTLLLMLPQQKQRSGSLTINYKNQDVVFNLEESKPSDLIVVCMAAERSMTSRQGYRISAAPGKTVSVIVLHLLWMDSFKLEGILTPDKFPCFVNAVKLADDALCGWRGATPAPSDRDKDRMLDPLKAAETNMLCVALREKYEPMEFSLSQLKKNDKFYHQVLACLNYIDVSLADVAVLPHEKTKHGSWKLDLDKLYADKKLSHWPEKGSIPLSADPHFDKVSLCDRLVGKLKSTIDMANQDRILDLYYAYRHETSTVERYGVLVLRPKQRAEQKTRELSHIVRDIVNKLPSALEDMYTGKSEIRRSILNEISGVMDKIRNDAYKLTSDEDSWSSKRTVCEKNWPANALLYVCHRLNAPDEGLFFLKMIADNKCFCSTHQDTLDIKDAFNDKKYSISELTADFVKKFGWDRCRQVVLEMFETRVTMKSDYVQLATILLLGDCVQAAQQVLNAVMDKMARSINENGPYFTPVIEIMHFAEQMKCIDTDTAEDYYFKLVGFLKRIPTPKYLVLMTELTVHQPQEGSNDYARVFAELVNHIPDMDMSDVTKDMFERAMRLFREFSITDAVDKLWCRLVSDFIERNKKIDALLASFIPNGVTRAESIALLDNMSKVPGASAALDALVEDYVGELRAAYSDKTDTEELVNELLDSLKSRLSFVCLAENEKALSNPKRVETFCDAFDCVDLYNLGKLVVRFRRDEGDRLKKKSASCLMYRRLLEQVAKRDMARVAECAGSHFDQLVECCVWFGDDELTGRFVRRMTHNDAVDHCYCLPSKKLVAHIPRLLDMPGVCGEPGSVKLDRAIVTSLLNNWILSEMVRERDSPPHLCGSSFVDCFRVFVKMEMYRPDSEEDDVASLFLSWLSNMPPGILLHTVLALFNQEQTRHGPSLKKFPSCRSIFRQMCLKLFLDDYLKGIVDATNCVDYPKKLFRVFLWLGDDEVVSNYARLVETSPGDVAKLGCSLVMCPKIQEEAAKTPAGLSGFTRVLDCCRKVKQTKATPTSSWAIIGVKVDGEPKFERFLKTATKKVTFGPFTLQTEALECGKRLVTNPAWCLSYSIKKFQGGYDCEIVKTKKFLGISAATRALQKEIAELDDVRKKVLAKSVHRPPAEKHVIIEVSPDDVVEILPPAKRIKLAEVVTLD